ncbi:MAG: adenine deaminase C-terminal domain-containing protein [Armatimonadota bacterium]|nr:adenine deaminase C-terminal domain-containing protein [Armatimonadota bacterium]
MRRSPEQAARWAAAHRIAAAAAAGRQPFDRLIANVRVVNVFTGEVIPGHIGVAGGLVSRLFDIEAPLPEAQDIIDGQGRFAVPGLIDCHLHFESTMVMPAAFAEAVVPLGVLTVTPDPHEIVNVMGLDGMRVFLEASRGLPLDVFLQVPSCVPATSLETAGARIGPAEVAEGLRWDGVVALGEVMDYPAVIGGEARMHEILSAALIAGAVIEGHGPNLSGSDLAAFAASGIDSDHTLMTPSLAVERLRNGMTVLLQEKSLSPQTLAAVEGAARALNLCLVTDDVLPDDLLARGHLDLVLREAIRMGLDPVDAICAVTLAPARRMRLYDRGGIAPGLLAHLVLTTDLEDFRAEMVFARGVLVAQEGRLQPGAVTVEPQPVGRGTVKIAPPGVERFQVAAPAGRSAVRLRVMEMNQTSTFTRAGEATLAVRSGRVDWEASDLCLAAVFERHGASGTTGYGFVRGALREGAMATTWAHDSHNLLVLGRSAAEMAKAARWVVEHDGGMAAVRGDTVLAGVPLPVAGIVSDQPISVVGPQVAGLRRALEMLGFTHRSPIMTLGVVTLAVSPELKVTDQGLVDVNRGRLVDLWLP